MGSIHEYREIHRAGARLHSGGAGHSDPRRPSAVHAGAYFEGAARRRAGARGGADRQGRRTFSRRLAEDRGRPGETAEGRGLRSRAALSDARDRAAVRQRREDRAKVRRQLRHGRAAAARARAGEGDRGRAHFERGRRDRADAQRGHRGFAQGPQGRQRFGRKRLRRAERNTPAISPRRRARASSIR